MLTHALNSNSKSLGAGFGVALSAVLIYIYAQVTHQPVASIDPGFSTAFGIVVTGIVTWLFPSNATPAPTTPTTGATP